MAAVQNAVVRKRKKRFCASSNNQNHKGGLARPFIILKSENPDNGFPLSGLKPDLVDVHDEADEGQGSETERAESEHHHGRHTLPIGRGLLLPESVGLAPNGALVTEASGVRLDAERQHPLPPLRLLVHREGCQNHGDDQEHRPQVCHYGSFHALSRL